jgi:hypothetical protein
MARLGTEARCGVRGRKDGVWYCQVGWGAAVGGERRGVGGWWTLGFAKLVEVGSMGGDEGVGCM